MKPSPTNGILKPKNVGIPWVSSSQECHSYQSSCNFVAKLLAVCHSKVWSPGSKKFYTSPPSPAKSLQIFAPQCDASVFFQFLLGWLQTTRHWARQLHPLPTPWIVALNLASNSLSREHAWSLTCTVANFRNFGDTGSKSKVKRKSSERSLHFIFSILPYIQP